MKRYLFIGGPWDGRRELVAPLDGHTRLGAELLPNDSVQVDQVERRPVSNGPNYAEDFRQSSAPITRFNYRREILQGNTGRVSIIYVHGDMDVLEALVSRYKGG